jgi:hypothetical protein
MFEVTDKPPVPVVSTRHRQGIAQPFSAAKPHAADAESALAAKSERFFQADIHGRFTLNVAEILLANSL